MFFISILFSLYIYKPQPTSPISPPSLPLPPPRRYDASNTDYDAFCDGTLIVVNLHSYLPKLGKFGQKKKKKGGRGSSAASAASTASAVPRTLAHEMVVTVTHELAHLLERGGGHGPEWRDTHMSLLQEIYADLVDQAASSSQ